MQGVDIQLGMAIDSTKATLAVKRRLACEMVKYWQQVIIFSNSYYRQNKITHIVFASRIGMENMISKWLNLKIFSS